MEALNQALATAENIVLGKPRRLKLALACLLARGHLLIEDIPGVGKTTLAQTLARVMGLEYGRIQFTSDLLPGDVVGVSIFDREQQQFTFQPGPIFNQVLHADEINRASPKTQSALLEAMQELQVTVDGTTRALPQPFFVIATQNPNYQIGTFPLPESQLDRFLMRLDLGYPSAQAERVLLDAADRRSLLERLEPAMQPDELAQLQEQASRVVTRPALRDYILALLQASREHPELREGLSPRAGLGLKHCAQAWALLEGRDHVLPEDVQAIFVATTAHRLQPRHDLAHEATSGVALARKLLDTVAVP